MLAGAEIRSGNVPLGRDQSMRQQQRLPAGTCSESRSLQLPPSFHYIPEVNRSFFVKLKHKVSEGSCRAYPSTATAAESSSSPGRALGSVVERALNQLPPSSNQQRVLLESPIESTDHVATHSVGAARKPAHCTLLDELFPPRETDRGSTQISNVRKNLGIPAMTTYPTREVLFKRLITARRAHMLI